MIRFAHVSVLNLENAMRGARNPLASWDKSDSFYDEEGNLIEKKELKQEIIEAILKLSDREMIILHFYYKEELSLACISEILNISMSRISQLHKQAIKNLRHHLLMKKIIN